MTITLTRQPNGEVHVSLPYSENNVKQIKQTFKTKRFDWNLKVWILPWHDDLLNRIHSIFPNAHVKHNFGKAAYTIHSKNKSGSEKTEYLKELKDFMVLKA